MYQKSIKELLHKLTQKAVEELIQNINTSSYINSPKEIKELKVFLFANSMDILFKEYTTIQKNFEAIGTKLFTNYHIPAITWQDILKQLEEDLLYAIHHNIVNYDADEFIKRMKLILNAMYKGYFYASVKESLNVLSRKIKTPKIELDIAIIEEWYQKLLQAFSTNLKNLPELDYELSALHHWSKSLDFQLLMKATSFGNKSNMLVLAHHIHNLAREITLFAKEENYTHAYNLLVLLDQKVNMLSDMLQKVLLSFNSEKLHHFFTLFAETILFDKHYGYFLTLNITPSIYGVHANDVKRLFLDIFHKIKEDTKKSSFDFTGVIDEGNAIHFLLQYNTKEDVKNMLQLMQESIKSLQEKEIVLFVPKFLIRAAYTESFSGLDAAKLQQLSLKMGSVAVHLPSYLLTQQECGKLREEIETDEKLNEIIIEKLHRKEIDLYFQPIVKIPKESQKLSYCETLVRIIHNDKALNNSSVIATIQREGLGALLDKSVFEKLADSAAAIAKITQNISANIFVESFHDHSVMHELKRCLQIFKKYQLTMTLEITEYNLFEHYQKLEDLHQEFPQTLEIAIDDFGSGYSSLAALIQLSSKKLLHAVKIDGSLTKNILDDDNSFEVVRMAMELSQKLGAKTIVEYVGTKELYKKLQKIGIPFYAQGYYFSQAVPLHELKKFLAEALTE